MSTLRELWRRRERSPLLSKPWFSSWARRALSLPALGAILMRAWRLRQGGARVGDMAIVERCCVEGTRTNLVLGRGVFIGRDCELSLHDRMEIGEQTVVNRRVTILTASHSLRDRHWRSYSRPVIIGDRAWIATGATILPGVTIGRGAVVGAGAVVRCDVPAYAVATGNPATIRAAARTEDPCYDTASFAVPMQSWLGDQRLTPSNTT